MVFKSSYLLTFMVDNCLIIVILHALLIIELGPAIVMLKNSGNPAKNFAQNSFTFISSLSS